MLGRTMRAAIALLMLTACGGATPTRTGELFAGRADGAPSMECLPDADVDEAHLTAHMRSGLELATAAFGVEAPPPPERHSTIAITEWSEGPLRTWLRSRSDAVDAARRELDAAAEEAPRQRIMAGAIVGVLYESLALVLGSVPAPDDLADEPEILEVFASTVRSQARPFLEHARRAYHACAANSVQVSTLHHWGRFCAAREDGLPDADEGPRGGTTVEVIADD